MDNQQLYPLYAPLYEVAPDAWPSKETVAAIPSRFTVVEQPTGGFVMIDVCSCRLPGDKHCEARHAAEDEARSALFLVAVQSWILQHVTDGWLVVSPPKDDREEWSVRDGIDGGGPYNGTGPTLAHALVEMAINIAINMEEPPCPPPTQ